MTKLLPGLPHLWRAAVLVSGFFATVLTAAAAERPNILWMLAEDIGPEVMSNTGTPETLTPTLDQLAKEGVRYTRAYTTAPVCSPSRSAMITGMYATTLGANQHRTENKRPLPEGVKILPERLREAGYYTANVVTFPPGTGFKGTGKRDWNFQQEGDGFEGREWTNLKSRQPFYAQINFNETHRVFRAPAAANPAKVALPPYYPDHPIARKDWAQYLDAGRELDRKVSKVLELLEKDGLADNTVVVFMGDNGQAHVRGKQFCYEEGLHVPLIIRWPKSLPKPEGFVPGQDDPQLLEAIDLTASTLAWAGIPKPQKMQGRVFLGKDPEPARELVFGARDRCDETVMKIRTVSNGRYRYIRNFHPEVPLLAPNAYKARQYPMWNLLKELHAAGQLTPVQAVLCAPERPPEELYDLQNDPHQIANLASSLKAEHQAILKELRASMERWIEETGDNVPDPDSDRTRKAATAATVR